MFGDSRSASADTVYTQMSVEDSYTFYGSEIDCVYYSTTGYKHVTLVPSPNHNSYNYVPNTVYGQNVPSWVTTENLKYVVYWAYVDDYSDNPSYLGISIEPSVHFENCNALRFCAATYLSSSYTASSAVYNESFVSIFGQTVLRYTNTSFIDNNIYPYFDIVRSGGNPFRVLPVWCDYTSDTLSTVSMLQVGFNGGHLDSGEIDVYLSCPLINDTAYGGSGIVTGTSVTTGQNQNGTDINVNVDVDMTETNGLLGDIIDVLDGIVDNIGGLFVPEEDVFDTFQDDLADLLIETFGGVDSDMLINVIEDLLTHGATNSVTFPAVTVRGVGGSTFTIASRSVSLKPHAVEGHDFYEAVALAIDLVCTCWVLNLIFDNLKRVIVGEKVVEIENVD